MAVIAATAASMTLLQLGIGTVNDIVDAPFDAGRKPGKPIPAGLVGADAARRLAVACFVAGVAMACSISIPVGLVALLVVVIGLTYDLRLKGTAWSWLPFAVGIPLLPVFGWLAGRGGLPPFFAVLLPAGVAAGAALAIGNSLVDLERDRAAGRASVAVALGDGRASAVAVTLFAVVWLAAVGSSVALASTSDAVVVALVGAPGLGASLAARRPDPVRRELAWRIEAVSVGLTAVAWLAGVVGPAG